MKEGKWLALELLCREKNRKAKAQLELERQLKILIYKHIDSKRRIKEHLHPLLDMRGNIVVKG